MPQMSPLSWLTLFFLFSIVYIIFNTLSYYVVIYPVKSENTTKSTSQINWKW